MRAGPGRKKKFAGRAGNFGPVDTSSIYYPHNGIDTLVNTVYTIYYLHNGIDTLVNTVYTTLRLSYNEIAFSNVYAEVERAQVERADLCHTQLGYMALG